MFEVLFGNATVEKILFYILIHGDGYATRMADRFNIALNGIQQQLQRLEDGGILVSEKIGKTRMYRLNLAYPLMPALRVLLRQALMTLEQEELRHYYKKEEEPMSTPYMHVRAMIVQNGYLLVASERGTTNTFLPGGIVDPEVGMEESLKSRLFQQFRGKIDGLKFAGMIESPIESGDETGFRTDMVYTAELTNYTHPERPKGMDIAFEFYWHPIAKMAEMNLKPQGMEELVWQRGRQAKAE